MFDTVTTENCHMEKNAEILFQGLFSCTSYSVLEKFRELVCIEKRNILRCDYKFYN